MGLNVDITALIKRITDGDRQAFGQVVDCYQGSLFGFLGRMGLSQSHAEEIAQETFIRAWKHLGDYDPRLAAFSTWLFTIARNLALNELARAAKLHEETMGDDLPDAACQNPQPFEALAHAQQKQRLQASLLKLPMADRSALALAYIENLDLAAIGHIEGCSVSAIKTRLHRAKQKLRALLGVNDG